MSGMKENKMSTKGEFHAKKSSGSGAVSSIEKVGSKGEHGIKFSMPKDCVDHSNVRGTIGKE